MSKSEEDFLINTLNKYRAEEKRKKNIMIAAVAIFVVILLAILVF